ncbi:MAG: pyruvate kinase [bacterium]
MVRTKIICTLGPASSSETVLRKMMLAGMDVARINFSHGSLDEHLARIRIIRHLNRKYRRHIRIMGDLEGHRIRIGLLKDEKPIEVKKRQILWLTTRAVHGDGDVIPFDYHGPLSVFRKGHELFIDDGNIALVVEGVGKDRLKTRVLIGGAIKERKGVNVPGAHIPFKGVAAHDRPNIQFCLDHELDFMALSFIRGPADVLAVRALMKGSAFKPKVIAKIENREGIHNIQGIIKVVDGVMVARGDMGVSIPIWEVPIMQKRIIRACNVAGKQVITATQMLESMVENRLPTRAEATDVANAIIDGTDYVMLSAESAVGHDPAGVVKMMDRIILFTERNRQRA